MKDLNKLKDLVLEKIDMASLMLSYNVDFSFDPRVADEVQCKCPFHGEDNRPSARYYKASQSFYCWYCKESWDAIGFIMRAEKMPFAQAVNFLIRKFDVDTSSVPEGLEFEISKAPEIDNDRIGLMTLRSQLRSLRGKVPFEKYRAIGYVLQKIAYLKHKGMSISETIAKTQDKIDKISMEMV